MTAAAALLCGPGLSIEEAVPDAGSQAASLHGLTTCQWLWVCSMILKPAGGYAIHDNPVLYTAISPFVWGSIIVRSKSDFALLQEHKLLEATKAQRWRCSVGCGVACKKPTHEPWKHASPFRFALLLFIVVISDLQWWLWNESRFVLLLICGSGESKGWTKGIFSQKYDSRVYTQRHSGWTLLHLCAPVALQSPRSARTLGSLLRRNDILSWPWGWNMKGFRSNWSP